MITVKLVDRPSRITRLSCSHQFRIGTKADLPAVGVTAFCPICTPRLNEDGQEAGETAIEVASILSQRTKQGMVELTLNREHTQMDLPKAREVVAMLQGAIEAAVSDQLLFAFLSERIGLDPEKASAALLDFRELRQGTRGVSRPQ